MGAKPLQGDKSRDNEHDANESVRLQDLPRTSRALWPNHDVDEAREAEGELPRALGDNGVLDQKDQLRLEHVEGVGTDGIVRAPFRARSKRQRSGAGGLEELDRVAGRVVDQDLLTAGAADDFVAKREASGTQPLDLGSDVVDLQVDSIPAAPRATAAACRGRCRRTPAGSC
jgi:hypothetical protein